MSQICSMDVGNFRWTVKCSRATSTELLSQQFCQIALSNSSMVSGCYYLLV